MRVNLDNLKNDINKIISDTYRTKSFTDYKSKIVSLLSLYQTYMDLTSSTLDLPVAEIRKYVSYMKRKKGYREENIQIYFENQKEHTELSKHILSTFNRSGFLDLYRELSERRISSKESLEIVKGFLSNFDVRVYEHFNHMLNEGLIDDRENKIDTNTTYFACILNRSYSVIDNCKRIDELSTLVHEVAHSYVQKDLCIRSRKQALEFHKSFYELYSMYIEYSFHHYLKENHIFIKDAILTENAHYSALRAYSRALSECGKISTDTKIDVSDLDFIVDSFEYFYALYLGLLMHEKSLIDREGTKERLDDFIAYQGLINHDEQLQILGFNRESLRNTKVLAKRLGEHNSNLRKYGHI